MEYLLAAAANDADLILDAPKLSQATESDTNTVYAHKSKAVALAAKERNKRTIRRHRLNWYEFLNNDSESEQEDQEEQDDVVNSLRNLNFSHANRLFYSSGSKEHVHSDRASLGGIGRAEREQLKTNRLRRQIQEMMAKKPEKSHVWQTELFPSKGITLDAVDFNIH